MTMPSTDWIINGARVETKFGPGTVSGFERIEHNKVSYVDTFTIGDRIGVRLDAPERWCLYKTGGMDPFFVVNDLVFIGPDA